ncbi:MAG: phage tail tape measure protein [Rhizobiaceae bacterium]|nr:phage tail tape measure protein [Rhizobiaceae bacterium]
MNGEKMSVAIEADTSGFQSALESLQSSADKFGTQLSKGLASAVVSGKELDDVIRQIGMNMATTALNNGLKPLGNVASTMFSSLLGGGTPVTPFATGGVVSSPTYFPMGGGTGLMGEAGAEAIMPLQRTADGKLGVAASGGGSPVNVVFNVSTQDASSFRKSEAQLTGMLARAVRRGTRTF